MYGKITVGCGTENERELSIIDYVKAKFKDDRHVLISQIEDGSYFVSVENNNNSNRNPQSTMWLTKESFIGLLGASMIYLGIKNMDLEKLLKESIDGDKVEYMTSDNLKPSNFNQ